MKDLGQTKRSLRIAMLIYYFLPVMGGAEQQAFRLSKALVERGHFVTIVTGRWSQTWPRIENIEGVNIYRNSTFDAVSRLPLFKHLAYELTLACYLVLYRKKYDIFHVHQALHTAFITSFIARLLGKKVIVKVGCGGEFSEIRAMKERIVNPLSHLMWSVIRRSDRIVAISREIEHELLDDGIPRRSVLTIPNGIQIDGVMAKTDYALSSPPRLMSVGRLTYQKAFDVLIQSLAAMKEQQFECSILGEGEERKSLQELIDSLHLGQFFHLQGVQHNLATWYASRDIFILVSRAEGLSNALLEAMVHGLPCIVSNIGGNVDLIAPECESLTLDCGTYWIASNGIIVNAEDAVGLCSAVRLLLSDHSLRCRLGESARKWVEGRYSMDRVVEQYQHLYYALGA